MSSGLKLSQFEYELPKTAIAQRPLRTRSNSKLLHLDRKTNQIIDRRFYELPQLLSPQDVIVRNNTKVLPVRLLAHKETGGEVEILLIKEVSRTQTSTTWQCLTRPGLKEGQISRVGSGLLIGKCKKRDGYTSLIEFNIKHSDFITKIIELGQTPLPPYLDSEQTLPEHAARTQYQTTYAQLTGSAAAPTAGLHFTPQLDAELRQKGIQIIEITLHVGLGTFLRVKTEDISEHTMHAEHFSISESAAAQINQAKAAGKCIIAVGTTSARVLESQATADGGIKPGEGETDLFIYPPYHFKLVDGLITNFHEPRSTLLMLVSAFTCWPQTQQQFSSFLESPVGVAYQHALTHNYRMLSFGDATMIK